MTNLLKTDEAAAYLGVRPTTLEHWRSYGKGPSHIKIGPRIIRYRLNDLDKWLEENVVVVGN